MPHADRRLAPALARALGVSDLTNVRRVTLTIEAGALVTVIVERFVAPECPDRVQRLRLRSDLPPEQLAALADAEPSAGAAK